MPKIIIEVEQGMIQKIFTTDKDTEVLVVDRDFEGADNDELISDKEIKKFCGKNKFAVIDYNSGIYEKDFEKIAEKILSPGELL